MGWIIALFKQKLGRTGRVLKFAVGADSSAWCTLPLDRCARFAQLPAPPAGASRPRLCAQPLGAIFEPGIFASLPPFYSSPQK